MQELAISLARQRGLQYLDRQAMIQAYPPSDAFRFPLLIGNDEQSLVWIQRLLGHGKFGIVFQGVRLATGETVAVKVEPVVKPTASLMRAEVCWLVHLNEKLATECVPRIYDCGTVAPVPDIQHLPTMSTAYRHATPPLYQPQLAEDYRRRGIRVTPADYGFYYVTLECLVRDLEANMRQPHLAIQTRDMTYYRLSPVGVLLVAYELIKVMQVIHDAGVLHRDIKPANFMTRYRTSEAEGRQRLVAIDFGLAKNYFVMRNGEREILSRDRHTISGGTPLFMPVSAHSYQQQSRAEELEALFYMLLYLQRGTLPWSGLQTFKPDLFQRDRAAWEAELNTFIKSKKLQLSEATLRAQGTPPPLIEIWEETRRCAYEERPRYEELQQRVADSLAGCGITPQDPFDWELTSVEFARRLLLVPVR